MSALAAKLGFLKPEQVLKRVDGGSLPQDVASLANRWSRLVNGRDGAPTTKGDRLDTYDVLKKLTELIGAQVCILIVDGQQHKLTDVFTTSSKDEFRPVVQYNHSKANSYKTAKVSAFNRLDGVEVVGDYIVPKKDNCDFVTICP